MLYLIIAILLTISLIFGVGCTTKTNNSKTEQIINLDSTTMYDKEHIEKMLKALSVSEPQITNSIGAMCYSPVMKASSAEYICPVCGEKTIYSYEHADFILNELPYIKSSIKSITKIDCKLDEIQFCKNCSPNIENPELCLTVNIDGLTEHISCNITFSDIILLQEFLNGSQIHKDGYDAETPLKNHLYRIEELLGIKL